MGEIQGSSRVRHQQEFLVVNGPNPVLSSYHQPLDFALGLHCGPSYGSSPNVRNVAPFSRAVPASHLGRDKALSSLWSL